MKRAGGSGSTSRRSFLKASGLAAAGVVAVREGRTEGVGAPGSEGAGAPEPRAAGGSGRRVDLVNVLQGTESTPEFSRGNTLPIAAMPFGMGHWTLESKAGTPWMFAPMDRRVQGVRCTHQLSPWLGDYGHATFLPVRGEIRPGAKARASSYDVEGARLRPYSLEVFLLRYRAHMELVPTERCAVLTATFDPPVAGDVPATTGLVIDIPGVGGEFEPGADKRSLRFSSKLAAGGVPENFATFYAVTLAAPWASVQAHESGDGRVVEVRFASEEAIEARIGTSFISFEQAERNLRMEMGTKPVAELREAGARRWEEHLGRVEIEGATETQARTFYSCLYRTLLFPRIWHEPDEAGAMRHFSAFNGKVEPGVMYADHGYWDVYRAWYPFMTVLFPERLGEILQAWVNAYKEGGWLPQFPAPGYRACMTGSLIDSVFGDAAAKGVGGFDLATAYEGLKKHATEPGDPAKGYGRVGVEWYLKLGYVAADKIVQSVAETVDAAYGDFCIAQVAKALGKTADADFFLKRSRNWRTLFDPTVKFLRGKNADGSWMTPFNQFRWGNPYVEGGAWQHRWDAPHDLDGLMELMGGKAASGAALEQMLTLPPVFHAGFYGQEIHEMSEMAAVPFGQYDQGNQPDHHVLPIFTLVGEAERGQMWTRRVLAELYTPDKFPGDEDTGSMAAWYVLQSLGFYPVCPGKPEYVLGSPVFQRAVLHLSGGKRFVIETEGGGVAAVSVAERTWNGRKREGSSLSHADLMGGGTLRCRMA